MAPSPEHDKEPKAPDKTSHSSSSEETRVPQTSTGDNQEKSESRLGSGAASNDIEDNKHVETLDDGQLRALLDEVYTYKCPKDREKKSLLFNELLEEVEQDEEAVQSVLRRGARGRRGRLDMAHSGSLQDLVAALADPAPRRRHAPVSARTHHGGSLPSGVDTSFLMSEEPVRSGGGGDYIATVRCVNPPPLSERRVSATEHEMELINRRAKISSIPVTYTSRATLEINSGAVCSGRAHTTTTSSSQVRTRLHHSHHSTHSHSHRPQTTTRRKNRPRAENGPPLRCKKKKSALNVKDKPTFVYKNSPPLDPSPEDRVPLDVKAKVSFDIKDEMMIDDEMIDAPLDLKTKPSFDYKAKLLPKFKNKSLDQFNNKRSLKLKELKHTSSSEQKHNSNYYNTYCNTGDQKLTSTCNAKEVAGVKISRTKLSNGAIAKNNFKSRYFKDIASICKGEWGIDRHKHNEYENSYMGTLDSEKNIDLKKTKHNCHLEYRKLKTPKAEHIAASNYKQSNRNPYHYYDDIDSNTYGLNADISLEEYNNVSVIDKQQLPSLETFKTYLGDRFPTDKTVSTNDTRNLNNFIDLAQPHMAHDRRPRSLIRPLMLNTVLNYDKGTDQNNFHCEQEVPLNSPRITHSKYVFKEKFNLVPRNRLNLNFKNVRLKNSYPEHHIEENNNFTCNMRPLNCNVNLENIRKTSLNLGVNRTRSLSPAKQLNNILRSSSLGHLKSFNTFSSGRNVSNEYIRPTSIGIPNARIDKIGENLSFNANSFGETSVDSFKPNVDAIVNSDSELELATAINVPIWHTAGIIVEEREFYNLGSEDIEQKRKDGNALCNIESSKEDTEIDSILDSALPCGFEENLKLVDNIVPIQIFCEQSKIHPIVDVKENIKTVGFEHPGPHGTNFNENTKNMGSCRKRNELIEDPNQVRESCAEIHEFTKLGQGSDANINLNSDKVCSVADCDPDSNPNESKPFSIRSNNTFDLANSTHGCDMQTNQSFIAGTKYRPEVQIIREDNDASVRHQTVQDTFMENQIITGNNHTKDKIEDRDLSLMKNNDFIETDANLCEVKKDNILTDTNLSDDEVPVEMSELFPKNSSCTNERLDIDELFEVFEITANVCSQIDTQVDTGITFGCITTPAVVASCSTTPSTLSTVAADPKPLQLCSSYSGGGAGTGAGAGAPGLAGAPSAAVGAGAASAGAGSAGAGAVGLRRPRDMPGYSAQLPHHQSIIGGSGGGVVARVSPAIYGTQPEEQKKSVDENANAVQSYSLSIASSQKKPRDKKKKTKNETLRKADEIDGYQGDKNVDELIKFIESNSENGRGHKLGKMVTKHREEGEDKNSKKRSTDRRSKDKENKLKRANSMEELSRTKLEDLTDKNEPSLRKKHKERSSDHGARNSERRSWGDNSQSSYNSFYSPPEKEPPAREKKKIKQSKSNDIPMSIDLNSDAIESLEFQTVTKKRKPKKRFDESDRESNACGEMNYRKTRQITPDRRRKSAPPSDKSNDSNDDLDSVHSLPTESTAERNTRLTSSCPSQVSYADIARTRHNNIPDLIESCNFYNESDHDIDEKPQKKKETDLVNHVDTQEAKKKVDDTVLFNDAYLHTDKAHKSYDLENYPTLEAKETERIETIEFNASSFDLENYPALEPRNHLFNSQNYPALDVKTHTLDFKYPVLEAKITDQDTDNYNVVDAKITIDKIFNTENYPALDAKVQKPQRLKETKPSPTKKVEKKKLNEDINQVEDVANAPDVVLAPERRPAVILMDEAGGGRDMDGVTFGFDINEQLLGEESGCDLVLSSGVQVKVAGGPLRYLPPAPLDPARIPHLDKIVNYVGSAWEEIIRCSNGKVIYFSE